jgi:hypothetical protein
VSPDLPQLDLCFCWRGFVYLRIYWKEWNGGVTPEGRGSERKWFVVGDGGYVNHMACENGIESERKVEPE